MRPSIVPALAAIVTLALAACSSNNLGGGDAQPDGVTPDGAPANDAPPDGDDAAPPCFGRTLQYCLSSDCHTTLGMETCTEAGLTCPAGQRHSWECSDGGLPCPGGGSPCYSTDCTRVVSCSDVALCPAGQLYPSQCFGGADAGTP